MHILYGCMFKVIIMNKRLKCCFIILVLVLNMVFSKQGFGEETKELKESELSAKSAVLIDGKTGRVAEKAVQQSGGGRHCTSCGILD